MPLSQNLPIGEVQHKVINQPDQSILKIPIPGKNPITQRQADQSVQRFNHSALAPYCVGTSVHRLSVSHAALIRNSLGLEEPLKVNYVAEQPRIMGEIIRDVLKRGNLPPQEKALLNQKLKEFMLAAEATWDKFDSWFDWVDNHTETERVGNKITHRIKRLLNIRELDAKIMNDFDVTQSTNLMWDGRTLHFVDTVQEFELERPEIGNPKNEILMQKIKRWLYQSIYRKRFMQKIDRLTE